MASSIKRIIVNTAQAPRAIGPYNQSVLVDKTLFISGQLGFNPSTMEIVKGGVEAEARQALKNMGEILKAANSSFNNVVKTTVLLQDLKGQFTLGIIKECKNISNETFILYLK